MKILIVSSCPTHPVNAGNRRAILAQANILEKLGNEVHFLYVYKLPYLKSKASFKEDLRQTSEFWGEKIHVFNVSRILDFLPAVRRKLCKIFRNDYQSIDSVYPHGLHRYVNKIDAAHHFDICIINYAWLSKLFTRINIPKKAIYTHDCLAYKDIKTGIKYITINAHEEAIGLQRCPHIFSIQEEEGHYFERLSPKSAVYNVCMLSDYHAQAVAGNHNMVFLSSFNDFNQEGIKWFIKDILPSIRKEFSDATLLVGGPICTVLPEEYKKAEGVKLLGYVENASDLYAKADVAINPVFHGTGLKIKTIEGISYDKVTIVHPHSLEGIYRGDRAPLLTSSTPEAWVNNLKKVWNDPEFIKEVKKKDEQYIAEMNAFIVGEYKRFLDA